MKLFFNILASSLFIFESASAQPHIQHHSSVAIPSHISAGDQTYSADVGGLGDYMESLAESNPKAHGSLKGDYDNLRSQRNMAWGIGGSMMAGGLIWATGGFTFLAKEETVHGVKLTEYDTTAILGGMGLLVAGSTWVWLASPDRKDFMQFINKHNKVNSHAPLKLNLGFLFNGVPGIQLSYDY